MVATLCLLILVFCQLTSSIHIVPESIGQPLSVQFVTVQRHLFSHCPDIFRYSFNGKEWFGLLIIHRPAPKGVPSRLKVLLSIGFYLSSVSLVSYYHRRSRFHKRLHSFI